ncbi:hypothetical protein OH76DRAFT_1367227, partial [Lentinus brumalis]
LYSELYNSIAMIEVDRAIKSTPHQPGDGANLKYAVAPNMLYSDLMHLMNFGATFL